MTIRQVASAVWKVGGSSAKFRPRVAVLGGVHGNERTGVQVVRRLVERFSAAPPDISGELTLAVGNPEAVDRDVRYVEEDLNRCFGQEVEQGGPNGDTVLERRRARDLAPHLQNLDVLIDLHATNKPSEPFVRLPGPVCESFFQRCERAFLAWLPHRCNTVLWDPDELIAGGSMTDEFAMRHRPDEAHSGAYICYESGIASDVSAVASTEIAVERMLQETGMLNAPKDQQDGDSQPRSWTHFQVTEKFVLDERGFEWAGGHGAANFEFVAAGETYGRLPNCAEGSGLRAAEDSYIVFPKVQSLWATGRPLGWLARRIDCDGSLPVS
eukprot:TRINITY_DN81030_c0_g1_i1.p1 TRINITY_DN81030_c0_g1~~TRINITY_DN81030_c0_g1_i1.p1  ORF type:complete len:345 (-),score=52.18 TRINITY_DN81030_c0_g1_i1:8-985(-)